MNCRKVNNNLSAYIDAELPGVEQMQVRQHLRMCSTCNDEYESLLLTKRLLSSLQVQEPCPQLERRILDQLAAEESAPSAHLPWRSCQSWWSVLAYPQKLRLSMLFATTSVAVAMLVIVPRVSRNASEPAGDMVVAIDPRVPSPALAPSMPVNTLVNHYNPSENIAPGSKGFTAVQVSLDRSFPDGR